MLGKLRNWLVAAVCGLFAAVVLGVPATAQAATIVAADVHDAHLTKIVNAPNGTDATDDTFTFTFTAVDGDSTHVAVIPKGECPNIEALTLKGVDMRIAQEGSDATPSALDGGTFAQSVTSVSFAYILGMESGGNNTTDRTLVTFPRAGEYSYRVVESGSHLSSPYTSINSKAQYVIHIFVKNTENGPVADKVLVESEFDDFGAVRTGKVEAILPELDNNQQTIKTEDGLAVGTQGCNVEGVTFGNRYIAGGGFIVEKIVEGDYGDKTKWFTYKLTITDTMAQAGSAYSYTLTEGTAEMISTNHVPLDHVESEGPYECFVFAEGQHTMTIEFKLKDGGQFAINGVWGTVASQPFTEQGPNDYRKKWATGLNEGTSYELLENGASNYTAKIFCYGKSDAPAPTFSSNAEGTLGYAQAARAQDVTVESAAGGLGTHVYVVNKFDDDSVSFTGIFIDNLPYILMVGVPLAVFVVMFVRKRRASTMAA